MANAPRFGLVGENAYFAKVDQMLLESLRETLELQEEAKRCADAGRSVYEPDRGEAEPWDNRSRVLATSEG